jgi:chorismate mutase/prephenate dehydratase
MRVSFLGPEGTFTHQAAVRHFGENGEFLPARTIASVFDEVESGGADMGVVPVENALEGTVNITLDRLIDSPLHIVGEVLLSIDIHLLTKAKRLDEIERVMSHPHAVAQCQPWLRKNLPDAEIVEVASTSLAAKEAAKNQRAAALGSRMAAERFDLTVLVEKLDSESINVTRFFVLAEEPGRPGDPSRTSILFVLRNEPGTLYDALGAIAERGLNMTKIESRPSRRRAWDYVFFMDIDGHADDPLLAEGLAELERKTEFFRLLGSYPISQ